MSNKNFGEPWEGKIERIRENLREGRYAMQDGIFPIVKELIQNAEDARARRLLLAWNQGLSEANHPLLHGPALLAVNDGTFDTANARAIREMGLSSKAADSSSIGKFGLGMKSVFHLGEVFFFVAADQHNRRIDADIRSPWSTEEGGLHPDWDDFGENDIRAIENRVRSLFGGGQWFGLWVPLRKQSQCRNIDPIEPYFPGDSPSDDLLSPVQIDRVPSLLPLLSHLQIVQLMIERGVYLFQVATESTRRSPLHALPDEISKTAIPFGGKINSHALGIPEHSFFAFSRSVRQ